MWCRDHTATLLRSGNSQANAATRYTTPDLALTPSPSPDAIDCNPNDRHLNPLEMENTRNSCVTMEPFKRPVPLRAVVEVLNIQESVMTLDLADILAHLWIADILAHLWIADPAAALILLYP